MSGKNFKVAVLGKMPKKAKNHKKVKIDHISIPPKKQKKYSYILETGFNF